MSAPTDLLDPTSDGGLGGETKVDFRSYWRTVRKRWPFVVLSMIIATVVAFVYTYRQAKVYEASCQIIIEPQAPDFSGFIFKIQANMDPKHRDRLAFVRVCSG